MTDNNRAEVTSLLSVTMTREAANSALLALGLATSRIAISLPDTSQDDERSRNARDVVQWLEWLGSRIRVAQSESNNAIVFPPEPEE